MNPRTTFRIHPDRMDDHCEVEGRLTCPEQSKAPHQPVLLCAATGDPLSDDDGLLDDLEARLLDAGLAVIRYQPAPPQAGVDHAAGSGGMAPASVDFLMSQHEAVGRWIAQRDDLNYRRLALTGFSSGALIAMELAARLSHVVRLCLINPLHPRHMPLPSGTPGGRSGRESRPIGNADEPADLAALADHASQSFVSKFEGEIMMIHAAADAVVAPESMLAYRDALQSERRVVEHVLVAHADHSFSDLDSRDTCIELIVRFLTQP